MIKIKIIDLLNMISNGEEVPERIMHNGIEWKYKDRQYYRVDEEHKRNIWSGYNFNILNDEVEIIEDNMIEKIDLSEWGEITYSEDWGLLTYDFNRNSKLFVSKLNKIIDKINKE